MMLHGKGDIDAFMSERVAWVRVQIRDVSVLLVGSTVAALLA